MHLHLQIKGISGIIKEKYHFYPSGGHISALHIINGQDHLRIQEVLIAFTILPFSYYICLRFYPFVFLRITDVPLVAISALGLIIGSSPINHHGP